MRTKVLAIEHGALSSLSRYGIAVLSVTLAAVLTLVLRRWGFPDNFAPFYVAVLASAWLGGFFPTLVATGLSASAIIFIFQPFFSLSGFGPYNSGRLIAFVLISVVVCYLSAAHARSEAARRASEQHYRELFDRNFAGVFLSTLSGKILDCNESFARILGYDSRKEAMSHPASDFYFEKAHRDSYIEQLQKDGGVTNFEMCVRGKDGRPIWLIENVTLIEDDVGALTLMQGTIVDVTERKRAEEALRESEARYRRIVETAGEGIWQIDAESRTTFVNEHMAEMLGYSVTEMDGASIFEFMDEEGKAIASAAVERRRRGIKERHDFKFRRKDCGDLWAIVSTAPIFDSAGRYAGALGLITDVTERRRAEEALRESEESYRDLVENSRELICTHDLDGRILSANRAAAEVLGYDTSDYSGKKNLCEILAPEVGDQFGDYLARIRKEGFATGLMLVQTSSGERRIWEYYNTLRSEGVATPIVRGMARDITERKQAEKALRESEERFRQLSEAAFEAIVIHENGTILEVNQSFCRMYGYERAEVIGKSVLDLTLPEFREPLLQRVRSRGTGSFEGLAFRKDGTIFRTEVAAKPIHYLGRVVRVAAIRDITEQKRNERRQAAQYAVTRVLAESATLAEATPQLLKVICESLRWKMGEFWRVCDSTNLLRCVETWHVPALDATSFIEASRQTELAPGVGLPGLVWQSGQPAWIPDITTDQRFARAAIATKIGLRGAAAFPVMLGNDTLGVMLFFSRRTPEVDEDLLKMMSAIGSQIGQFTERKRAEEALLASEHKYRDIFAFAPVGIYQSLRDGTLITANKSLAKMLGYASVDELLRVKLGSGMYLSEDEREKLIRKYESLGYAVDLDMQWKRKDGSPICVQLSAHAIKGANGATEYFEGFVRDVTEHKRAEEALREAERQYHDIFEHAVDGIFRTTPDGRFIVANPALASMLGYDSPADLIQDQGDLARQMYVEPERREEFKQQLREHGMARDFEFEVRRKDGSKIWISEYVRAVRDETGTLLYYEGTAEDITERKRIEEALRTHEAQLMEAQHVAHLGSWEWDITTDTVTWSDELHRIWGIDRKEFCETYEGVLQCIHPDDREAFDNVVQTSYRELNPYTCDHRIIRTDGEIRQVQSRGDVALDEAGNPVRMFGTSQDTTERKLAEEALRESEERYREVFENAQDAIYVHDLSGKYIAVNRAAEKLSGFPRTEIIGKNFAEFVDPKYLNEIRDRLCEKLAGQKQTVYEIELIAKDGRRVHVEVDSKLIIENGVAIGVQGMARDISDRKLAEEALRTLPRRLIGAQEAERRRIARELHDEIGQTLTAIRINLQSVQQSANGGPVASQLDGSLYIIDSALQQIRDLALDLRPSLLDDLGLVAALRWYLDREATRAGLILELNFDLHGTRLAPEIETTCFRIAQEALTNIVRHARAKRVCVKLVLREADLQLLVRDDGVGFDVEAAQHRFAAEASLGLQGMQERAIAVGGKLEIESTKGKGAAVRVHLPFLPSLSSQEED